MTNLEIVIHNSYKANELFYVDRHEASICLGEILKRTFTQPDFLAIVPDESAGALGLAYLNLLDLVNEPKIFQTLSTLGYYFISRELDYYKYDYNYNLLDKRILILNLGAQTFCRTIAKAKGLFLPNYIDFIDWQHFPLAVKYVLLLEHSDLEKMQAILSLPHDMLMRKQWLDSAVASGYFNEVCAIGNISDTALTLHNEIMAYLNEEIVKKGTFYFYG